MLTLTIGQNEKFDESLGEFVKNEGVEVSFEHSLVSIAQWEAKWEKCFLSDSSRTDEQTLDYLHFMVRGDIPENFDDLLTADDIRNLSAYIHRPMTATVVSEAPKASPNVPEQKQVITSEQIYSWMVRLQIPFECQDWHINRLLTLVRVINVDNSKDGGKKSRPSTKNDIEARRALNAQRRAQHNTNG